MMTRSGGGGARDGEEQENVMTRRKKRQVCEGGSGLSQQGQEPALQRSEGAQALPGSRATWVARYSQEGCPGGWHPLL